MTGRPFEELVTIGRLVRPRGLKGEVVAEAVSDRPDRFPSLRAAYVPAAGGGSRRLAITSCWPQNGRFVVKIEGVDSIEQAESYRGLELRIGEEELAALPAGSYYHHQLRGLRVEDPSGRELGQVADILEGGGEAVVLVVRGAQGEQLIPLATPFVKEVDLVLGRMVVTPLAEETVVAHGAEPPGC
jgi:16S rRNA processing protein RimM